MVSNDLEVVYGASFNTTLALTDISGNALNLSGYNARGGIKLKYSDLSPIAFFQLNIIDFISGLISIELDPSDTSGLFPASYIYSVEIYTSGNSTIMPVAQGRVNVQPMVF